MGQSHIFANPAKREYFTIEAFGEFGKHPLKVTEEDGQCLHAMALALLLLSPAAFGTAISGSWYGDVTHCPSDSSAPDSDGFNFGILTATESNPDKNFYQHAEDNYTDISVDVVGMLCSWDERYTGILFARAARVGEQMRRCSPLWRILIQLLERDSTSHYLNHFREKYQEHAERVISEARGFLKGG